MFRVAVERKKKKEKKKKRLRRKLLPMLLERGLPGAKIELRVIEIGWEAVLFSHFGSNFGIVGLAGWNLNILFVIFVEPFTLEVYMS